MHNDCLLKGESSAVEWLGNRMSACGKKSFCVHVFLGDLTMHSGYLQSPGNEKDLSE